MMYLKVGFGVCIRGFVGVSGEVFICWVFGLLRVVLADSK